MPGKTDTVFLQGKAKFARLHLPDQWGNYKITLYLSNASYEKFKELGVKNVVKKDEDGYFITLRRPLQKMMKGKVVGLAPPSTVDKTGIPLRDVMIGNGSDVTVKLAYYSYNTPQGEKGHAIRLEGVRVDNLVPYNPPTDHDPTTYEQVEGLDKQPEQTGF